MSDGARSALELRNADRKSKYVDKGKPERAHEVGGVVGHFLHGVGCPAARTRDTGVVEQDHWPARGQPVVIAGSQ